MIKMLDNKSLKYMQKSADLRSKNLQSRMLEGDWAAKTIGYQINEIEADYYEALSNIYNPRKRISVSDVLTVTVLRKSINKRKKRKERERRFLFDALKKFNKTV